MELLLHELIHLVLSLLAAFFVYRLLKCKSYISIVASIVGGFLIDIDHLVDYFFAFGIHFSLNYFLKGYQFLKSDRMYVPFHSWELVILLLIIFLIFSYFKNRIVLKTILLSFCIALFFHLATDVILNRISIKSYSFIYRLQKNFSLKELVSQIHYQKHLKQKKAVGL